MSSKGAGKGSAQVDDRVDELWLEVRRMARVRSLEFARGLEVWLQEQVRKGLLRLEESEPLDWEGVRARILAAFEELLDTPDLLQTEPMRGPLLIVKVDGGWSERFDGMFYPLHAPRMEGSGVADDPEFSAGVESDSKAAEPEPSAPSPPTPPASGVVPSPGPSSHTHAKPPSRDRSLPFEGTPIEVASAGLELTPDPPRTAYARLDAPEVAVSGEEMEVVVGLAEKPSAGVVGGAMTRPAASVGAYTLSIHLVADGFQVRAGETLRRELRVTAAAPYPAAAFHLTPEAQRKNVQPRALQAFFEVEGQTMGVAFRPLVVARTAALADTAEKPESSPGVDLSIPTEAGAPDLEIRILLVPDHPGRLLWTFNTRHPGIDLPDEALATEIGDEPQQLARSLVDKVNAKDGKRGIYRLLTGIGSSIAENIPGEMGKLLRAVAASSGGVPNVLILSQEPYVPWELATLEEPLLDPASPPFLAAQANVGRWVLPAQPAGEKGGRGPRQPPPTEHSVEKSAVVSGRYDLPGWNRLQEAEREAEELALELGAARVAASSEGVLRCLEGDPPAQLLHFAVHGIYDPQGVQDGLMLTDGETLDPYQVRGSKLAAAPFVFLNACQVGSGNKILGDYAGMAAAFLNAGASGVVAPLWSVKDTIAREIAEAFYAATAGETTPAAALRAVRRSFRDTTDAQSATYLAYQFFGHPALKLRFLQSRGDLPHGDPAQP